MGLRRCICVLLALLLLLPLTACSFGHQNDGKTGAGHSFSYTLVGNPDTLDPQLAVNSSAKTVLANLFEGLFTLDDSGAVQNGLVTDYTVSQDGLCYDFTLRSDSYWYQAAGESKAFDKEAAKAVTAMDFVYAFKRMFDPMYASPYRDAFSCIENAERITAGELDSSLIGVYAANATSLQIRLDKPNPAFLLLLTTTAALPCCEEFFESTKGRYGLDENSVIGNGSFAMQRWLYDPYGKYNIIQLCRNPLNHAVKKVYPVDLNFFIEKSDADARRIFTDGKTDCYAATVTDLRNRAELTAKGAFSLTLGLAANEASPYGETAEIFEAMRLSLDYTAIPEQPDSQLAGSGILPPASMLTNKSCRELLSDAVYRKFDPEAAASSLSFGMMRLGIQQLPEGRILAPDDLTDYEPLRSVMQQWKDRLGIDLTLETVPLETYEKRLAKGDYDLVLCAVGGEDPDPASLLRGFLAQPYVRCRHADEVRELVQKASVSANHSESVELYRQAETTLLSDNCFIPLFYKQRMLLCKPGVQDVSFNAFTGQVQFSQAKFFD